MDEQVVHGEITLTQQWMWIWDTQVGGPYPVWATLEHEDGSGRWWSGRTQRPAQEGVGIWATEQEALDEALRHYRMAVDVWTRRLAKLEEWELGRQDCPEGGPPAVTISNTDETGA